MMCTIRNTVATILNVLIIIICVVVVVVFISWRSFNGSNDYLKKKNTILKNWRVIPVSTRMKVTVSKKYEKDKKKINKYILNERERETGPYIIDIFSSTILV